MHAYPPVNSSGVGLATGFRLSLKDPSNILYNSCDDWRLGLLYALQRLLVHVAEAEGHFTVFTIGGNTKRREREGARDEWKSLPMS